MTKASVRTRLTLLYDPLCGWCYGATPAIRRLAQESELLLELEPVGLFAGPGARPMDERFAQYAWMNDQRIARLTGQQFSEHYRESVLTDRATPLDSGPAVVALTAVRELALERELPTLEAIQAARYVDGKDVTDYAVLAELLRGAGLDTAARRVEAHDGEVVDAATSRMISGRELLRRTGSSGVPTLVAHERSGLRVISSELLFGRIDDLLHDIGFAPSRPRAKAPMESQP